MKKIFAALVFIVWFISLLFALFAPFINPWWFLYSLIVAVIALPYGGRIQDWIFKTLEI